MFTPGEVIKTFITKKGRKILFRFPDISDVESCRQFINELSKEDTFITYSGEQLNFDEEKRYVEEWLDKMSKGDMVLILGFEGDRVVVNTSVTRMSRRSKHVGLVAISVHKDYREEGIGSEVLNLLEEYGRKMSLRMFELTVFANNDRAQHVYQKHGFQKVGQIPEKLLYRDQYIDEIVMIKSLH